MHTCIEIILYAQNAIYLFVANTLDLDFVALTIYDFIIYIDSFGHVILDGTECCLKFINFVGNAALCIYLYIQHSENAKEI